MQKWQEYFSGKKITLMGLGVLGRGVGDARFLAECGANVVVTDLKNEKELASSLEQLKEYKNITYHLGGHSFEDFQDCDLILKAAGVPLTSPYIAQAHTNKISVRMSADLLVELTKVKTVGVTGTRGKSTVAHLIAHILRKTGKEAVLGGNVRGVSNLSLIPQVHTDSILVLELDSWQLQGFGEARISPNVAVFTNLMQDHLNYYPDEETYFADKANIFKFQKTGDVLIGGKMISERIKDARPPISPIIPEAIPADWNLKIVGEHNRENAALAAEALRALGLTEEEIKNGIESFDGVEGRLQLIREIEGIKIYNDNNATTPEATVAALEALDPGRTQNIILIMGGADKGLDIAILSKEIKKHCKKVFLLAGTGTERITSTFPSDMIYHITAEAFSAAFASAQAGDIVLFSPAFASFGMFKNEYDRNDQFIKAVQEMN